MYEDCKGKDLSSKRNSNWQDIWKEINDSSGEDSKQEKQIQKIFNFMALYFKWKFDDMILREEFCKDLKSGEVQSDRQTIGSNFLLKHQRGRNYHGWLYRGMNIYGPTRRFEYH